MCLSATILRYSHHGHSYKGGRLGPLEFDWASFGSLSHILTWNATLNFVAMQCKIRWKEKNNVIKYLKKFTKCLWKFVFTYKMRIWNAVNLSTVSCGGPLHPHLYCGRRYSLSFMTTLGYVHDSHCLAKKIILKLVSTYLSVILKIMCYVYSAIMQ